MKKEREQNTREVQNQNNFFQKATDFELYTLYLRELDHWLLGATELSHDDSYVSKETLDSAIWLV